MSGGRSTWNGAPMDLDPVVPVPAGNAAVWSLVVKAGAVLEGFSLVIPADLGDGARLTFGTDTETLFDLPAQAGSYSSPGAWIPAIDSTLTLFSTGVTAPGTVTLVLRIAS